MPTELDKLIEQYAEELMRYSQAHPSLEDETKTDIPATPYTQPEIPAEQGPQMPVILPGEPLQPISEPPAVLPPLRVEPQQEQPPQSQLSDLPFEDMQPSRDDEGYLQIRAYTADEALPVEGALVTVTDREGGLVATMLTDSDGLTSAVALKTVARGESSDPQGADVYDTYFVRINKEGFLPFENSRLPIFGGVTNVQSVPLIPLPEFKGEN